jgi:hypothetical protein
MAIPATNDPSTAQQDGKARWFTPGRLLWLFCAMNMLVYLDRGARGFCTGLLVRQRNDPS